MRMKKYLLRLLALVMLTFATPALWAQVTTSALSGTVTDPKTKETLVGATIVAKHLPTGTTYGAITNMKGNYSIVGMRPGGPYTITVTYIGYQKASLSNISLALGETETLNVELASDTQQLSAVSVRGTRGSRFNAQKTGAGASFSRRNIERVPSVSRSIMDIAKLTPQSNGSGSFAGASSRYNSLQIDGAVNNDVFGLGGSNKSAVSLEAIDALQVVIAPFDVRQSGFIGGGMNAITKSGTNTFHGSIYDYYYNQDFYGTTAGKDVADRKKVDKQYENTVGFTLGGPIVKDKLFFFANGEYIKGVTPSTFTPGNGSRISETDVARIDAKLKELGYDAGGFHSQDRASENIKGLLRLDWNINAKNRLTLRYSHITDKPFSLSNSSTRLRAYNSGYTKESSTNTFVAELNSKLSDKLSNELRVSYSGIRDRSTYPGKPFPFISIGVGSGRQVFVGTDKDRGANELDQDIFALTNNLTLNSGNHTFTFGTHNEIFRMRNLYITNYFGNYEYRDRDLGKDAQGRNITRPGIEDFLLIGTPTEVAPSAYNYSVANVAHTGDPRWSPAFTAGQLGFYAQDEWKATDRFRLTYGLRVDLPFFASKPTANPAFNQTDLAKNQGITNNYLPPLRPLFSPRVGFRYQLDEARKYTLRGGTGIFTGRVPFVWVSNSFANTGIEMSRTIDRPARFERDVTRQHLNPATSEVDVIGKNFRYPQVWRSNLALDATLPGGIRATLEGMYTKNLNSVRFQNLILRRRHDASGANTLSLDQGHGQLRPLYEMDPVLRNSYTNIILLTSENAGYSYNVTGSLAKDFGNGLDASIAYTFGESKSINDATGSQAVSTWAYNYSNDINGKELAYSIYDMRHRIVGQLNYRVEYAKHFATTIGLIYNGQSGPRYSILYSNDINGDAPTVAALRNDLAYLPTKDEVAKGYFADPSQAILFEQFVQTVPGIDKYRGQIAPRNAFQSQFVHTFDLHFAQDFFLKVGGRKHTLQLNADILNVGNLLNRAWGLDPFIQFNNITPLSTSVDNAGVRSYNFSFRGEKPWDYADLGSRWRAQVGIKYTF